ncbi:hypothetical protein B9G53_24700 [Pseudanabaena sp. SR411]|uniref:NERD domain-containing protein n=1 Tax=Pseudanabaena sp. SR411 TaxID=1980935 RepID=UPI000B97D6F8|nr:NERD domain-containing protein [Pseudanabaena sp. SR411]OYQ61965.1 hypothetical protein B9G53_24700 [Pseudanabaena sp. SR411]
MAKMFPKTGPQDTGSTRAEPDLYWRLSKYLSDEFTVIHSLPWLASVSKEIDGRSVPTGEIDFLILHRELGILAVEVKGGIFTHDRTEFVYKRTGQKIDPIRQVRRGTHALAQWLHESGAGSWRIGYCILFPHSEMREAIPIALIDRTVNPPQPIVFDINALNDIGKSIQDVMIYWKKALGSWSIKEQQLQKLVDVILPSSDYTPCWETRIKNDIVTWLQLTPEQVVCLKKIEKEARLVVTGSAGTGKTLLLIEHARRLSALGQKVLVLTYNTLLANRLREELSDLLIEVYTFHQQCRRAAKVIGNPVPNISDSSVQENFKDWYSIDAPNALQQALNEKKLENYDALIIDEGQVLHINWLKTLYEWFSEKRIIVFCDSTQVFSFEHSTSPEEISATINAKSPYTLTVNLRSPRTVFERILEVKSTEYQQFCPRLFEPDTLSEIAVQDMRSSLNKIINQLIEEEKISIESIVIIDATNGSQKEGNYLGIQIISAAKFRGLEAPVVVVWAGLGSDETSLLCAYTRATSRCIVIYDALAVIKGKYKAFGQIILELDKKGDIKKESSLVLTSSIFSKQGFNLIDIDDKTISLYWCSDWNGWIIYPTKNKQVAQLMWIYHLTVTTDYPVYTWREMDSGKLQYFKPVNSLKDDLGKDLCNLSYCKSCNIVTPFLLKFDAFASKLYRENDECAVCSSVRTEIELNKIDIQIQFAQILSQGNQASNSDKKRLSIFLMALGRWNTIGETQKQELEDYFRVRSGTIGYNVAHLLILSDLLKIEEMQHEFGIDEAATKYRDKWCPDLVARIDQKSWRGMVAHGFNTWLQQKVIEKVDKGIYKKTANFQEIIHQIILLIRSFEGRSENFKDLKRSPQIHNL